MRIDNEKFWRQCDGKQFLKSQFLLQIRPKSTFPVIRLDILEIIRSRTFSTINDCVLGSIPSARVTLSLLSTRVTCVIAWNIAPRFCSKNEGKRRGRWEKIGWFTSVKIPFRGFRAYGIRTDRVIFLLKSSYLSQKILEGPFWECSFDSIVCLLFLAPWIRFISQSRLTCYDILIETGMIVIAWPICKFCSIISWMMKFPLFII